jgi:hypothetical protein
VKRRKNTLRSKCALDSKEPFMDSQGCSAAEPLVEGRVRSFSPGGAQEVSSQWHASSAPPGRHRAWWVAHHGLRFAPPVATVRRPVGQRRELRDTVLPTSRSCSSRGLFCVPESRSCSRRGLFCVPEGQLRIAQRFNAGIGRFAHMASPVGTTDYSSKPSVVPTGLGQPVAVLPAMNRWAIFSCPSGARRSSSGARRCLKGRRKQRYHRNGCLRPFGAWSCSVRSASTGSASLRPWLRSSAPSGRV